MQVQIATCEKCRHQWIMRVDNPLKCPKCGHIRGSPIRTKKAAGQAHNQTCARHDRATIGRKPQRKGASQE